MVRYKARYVLMEFASQRDRDSQELLQRLRDRIYACGGIMLSSVQSPQIVTLGDKFALIKFAQQRFGWVKESLLADPALWTGEQTVVAHISGSVFQMQKFQFRRMPK